MTKHHCVFCCSLHCCFQQLRVHCKRSKTFFYSFFIYQRKHFKRLVIIKVSFEKQIQRRDFTAIVACIICIRRFICRSLFFCIACIRTHHLRRFCRKSCYIYTCSKHHQYKDYRCNFIMSLSHLSSSLKVFF